MFEVICTVISLVFFFSSAQVISAARRIDNGESELITRVTVSSFKAIQKASIDFGRLTVFVGENGTGKSSIVHALSILKRSKDSQALNTDLPYANLGPLSDLVHAGKDASIEISGRTDVVSPNSDVDESPLGYACKIVFDVQGLSQYVTQGTYGPFKFSNDWNRYGPQNLPATPWIIDNIQFNVVATNQIGRLYGLQGYGFPSPPANDVTNQQRQYRAQRIYQSLDKASLTMSKDLDQFFVVPPLRGFTESSYTLPGRPNQDLVSRAPESQVQVAANLKYWENNEKTISKLLSDVVGVEVEIKLSSGPSVRVLNAKNAVNFVNEGFGANQLLWVFERIVNSPDESLIVVEEPETHLHPKAQFALGKLLAEAAFGRKKLILLTHSPHLLSGILTAVKSKKAVADDVALYFFDKKPTGIQVSRAAIDKEGVVEEGLRSFMEAAASELVEYASAGV